MGLSCIVIDDENHIRVLLKSVLGLVGLNVVGEAANGLEGVELFEKIKPDFVFMDINMPLKTGDEVLEEMKKIHPLSFIVMLTSVADLDTVERCIKAGADFYIRKDTPVNELKEIIQEILSEMRD
jgi:two-component system chemotaxis response regulator CheY